ncbi:DUF4132 domain-containing protein [Glycomyces harbinensis]|uniref:DUF4132 domain-containing protein n=1 Tax=Glycomyces harbinensis TaxID=58114 RepID=A0A1G7AF94_9ACTN|nr:DUF4132 domain-containing protein [Glycomyces harbinensis]SDE13127.1 protein of unknown function [Glycomyces harbinensis]
MSRTLAAPQDQVVLPASWTKLVLPRRGNGVRSSLEAGPEAAANVAARVAAAREALTTALERPEADPDLARAALAHLAGEANPVGAGAVATLLRFTDGYRGANFDGVEKRARVGRELFGAWLTEHGPAFAVSALIEDLSIDFRWYDDPDQGAERLPTVVPGEPMGFKWVYLDDRDGPLAIARSTVAAAGPDEYERVAAMAAGHRDTPVKRLAAAVLLPDETAWVAEACEERSAVPADVTVEPLVWASVSEPDHVRRFGAKRFTSTSVRHGVVAELVGNLGAEVLPLFATALGRKGLEFKQRSLLYEGVALLPCDDAARLLVEHVGEPEVLAGLRRSALRFPARFARAAAERASGLSSADAARLLGALRQDGVPLDDVLKGLGDDERAKLDGILSESSRPVARAEDLPEALWSPPWAERKRRKAEPPLEGLEAPGGTVIVWGEGEYERALAIEPEYASWDADTYWDDPADYGLGFADRLWARLAHGDAAAADTAMARMKDSPKYAHALVPIRSAAAAALAADWFARLKSARAHAADWLDRHGAQAVPLLVPGALGGDKRERAGGEAALRHLGRRLGAEAVLQAAEPFGPEAAARLRDILAVHPHVPLNGPPSKPGSWVDLSMLPPVMLRGKGTALPLASVEHLVRALSLWSPRLPFPGVELYAEHCEHDSLNRFSLALFELWLRSEAPSKDSWAVEQLGSFGDEATAAALGPLVTTWPGRSQADRALLGVEVLAHIGTDNAFAYLRELALPVYSNTVAERARVLADRLAAARGLDFETYADRLVPDHGVTDPETLTFDYGDRRFHLRFDHLLAPRLTDETGRERARLPKAGVHDDAALAKDAASRYKKLVKAVETTAEQQIERLRDAMVKGRTWSLEDFRVLLAHPLVHPFARRLVWFAGQGFRVAEDGGFADVHDRDFTPEGPIRVAHPALLGEDTPAWARLLGDYEVLQPFDQLGRPAAGFTEAELATGRLERFDGATATYASIEEHIGWRQPLLSPEAQTKRIWCLTRQVPGGWLLADTDPNPDPSAPNPNGVLTLKNVRLMENRNRHPKSARPLPGRRLDPVAAAELIGTVEAATGKRSD